MSNLQKSTEATGLTTAAARALAAYQSARGIVPSGGTSGLAILADCSGSMFEPAAGGKTRYQVLMKALTDLWPELSGATLYGFSYEATQVAHPSKLPDPSGGTYLAEAIKCAAMKFLTGVVVISDGIPQCKGSALTEARKLHVPFSTLFVGDPKDTLAVDFMKQLARTTGGKSEAKDLKNLASPLVNTIRGLLPS